MRGKNKCKILKEIRQKIADENDIPFVTQECSYQGECSGTCPKCEAELRYLEQQLEKRQRLGKTVTVAALSAGLVVGAVSLTANPKEELRPLATEEIITTESQHVRNRNLEGRLETESTEDDMHAFLGYAPPEDWEELDGAIPNEDLVLEGDVAYIDPSTEVEFAGAPLPEFWEELDGEPIPDESLVLEGDFAYIEPSDDNLVAGELPLNTEWSENE